MQWTMREHFITIDFGSPVNVEHRKNLHAC